MMDFYRRHYQALQEPILSMMLGGIRVDEPTRAAQYDLLLDRCDQIRLRLDFLVGATLCQCTHLRPTHVAKTVDKWAGMLTKAGKPRKSKMITVTPCTLCSCAEYAPTQLSLIAESDLSHQRVAAYLYGHLGLPKQRKRGEDGVTVDEVALRKLRLKVLAWKPLKRPVPKTARWKLELEQTAETLDLLLEHREKSKLLGFVGADKVDPDGYMRCTLKVTTENGRLASAKNPMGTGGNLQTIPRPTKDPHTHIRAMFVPDSGHLLMECDLSQVEDRIVKVLSKDPEAILQARLRPTEFDAHSVATRRIYAKILRCRESEVEITKDRRDIGKRTRHGVSYGEGERTLQEILLKDGHALSLPQCRELIQAAQEPYVLAFQRETRRRIMRDRMLTNSWGRQLLFTYDRLDDQTYRRGYAFRAASENADLVNQCGVIPVFEYIEQHHLHSRLVLQIHDSLLLSVDPTEAYDLAQFIIANLERERSYEGVPLRVPVEIKLGTSWLMAHEWKALPAKAEFNHAIDQLLERLAA